MTQEELIELKMKTRDLMENEMEELSKVIEATHKVPERVYELLIGLDLFQLTLPKKYGGYGLSMVDYFPILEEVAKSHGVVRMLVHGANGLWRLIEKYGTEQQKDWLLPLYPTSKPVVAFALTEPETGSGADVGTTARLEGDFWILNGKKTLITFADTAMVQAVIAKTQKDEVSAFLVPQGAEGLTIEEMPDTMGCHGSYHGNLFMNNCRIPKENLLGEVGQGLEIALRGFLDISRTSIAQSCVGLAQRSMDIAIEFAKQRVTFGKPISKRQVIQQMLGDMATQIQAGRLLVLDAAKKFDAGEDITVPAAMAKYFCLEMVSDVTDQALEIFGGSGYTQEHTMERLFRDGRAMRFEEGTAHIQKATIARSLV